ncbi:nucleotidyltransferase domain-containing protein [Candidatus Bathyarchaeota archaeon]|nr:nucleotidyltransferase domain-containing protein [Candidatus Bathyarchaeota archaeon]
MFKLTSEGKIIQSLKGSEKTFTELLNETGLSPRWLSIKLEILMGIGLVRRSGRVYSLHDEKLISHPLIEKLIRISGDLYANPWIISAILFGGVARGTFTEENDLDIVLIVKKDFDVRGLEWALESKYDIGIDLFWFTKEGFFRMLASKATFLFGMAEGYKVLFEKEKGISDVLNFKTQFEIKDLWEYNKEAGTWFQKQKLG